MTYSISTSNHISNNHTLNGGPFVDICDYLSAPNGSTATKGKVCYPKDFKFTGWHPLCRCFTQTILKTDDEVWEDTKRIMRGDKPSPVNKSKNYVDDAPDEFKAWCRLNAGRVERAKSLPYFIRDNQGYYDSVIVPKYGVVQGVKLGRTAEKEAYRLYKDLPAPKLSNAVETNTKEIANSLGLTHTKPMTFLGQTRDVQM